MNKCANITKLLQTQKHISHASFTHTHREKERENESYSCMAMAENTIDWSLIYMYCIQKWVRDHMVNSTNEI